MHTIRNTSAATSPDRVIELDGTSVLLGVFIGVVLVFALHAVIYMLIEHMEGLDDRWVRRMVRRRDWVERQASRAVRDASTRAGGSQGVAR